jgi:hypothetical protein
MAKQFQVTHCDDALVVTIRGDRRNPEPATAVVKFPGGHVEVSRCSDGTYWAHIQRTLNPVEEADEVRGEFVDSRIDYTPEAWRENGGAIPPIPAHAGIQHIAVRVARAGGAA